MKKVDCNAVTRVDIVLGASGVRQLGRRDVYFDDEIEAPRVSNGVLVTQALGRVAAPIGHVRQWSAKIVDGKWRASACFMVGMLTTEIAVAEHRDQREAIKGLLLKLTAMAV